MGFLRNLIDSFNVFLEKRREKRRIEQERRRVERERRLEEERRRQEQERFLYRLGNNFEDYVIGMFDPEKFELIHRTPTNDDTNGKFVHSMVYPDLRFREIATGRKFWVEVKFRAHTEDRGVITWCNDNQLRNYKKTMYESRNPVFIMVGLGGTVQNPEKIFCLNLDRINFTTLYYGTYVHNRVINRRIESFEELITIDGKAETNNHFRQ